MILHRLLSQPLPITPLQCFLLLCSWGFMVILIGYSARTLQQGITHLKRLHSIPCHRCAYYTGHYQLKCTVRPTEALTEQAIHCPDCIITHSIPAKRASTMPSKACAIPSHLMHQNGACALSWRADPDHTYTGGIPCSPNSSQATTSPF
jgi:hypothetical protein